MAFKWVAKLKTEMSRVGCNGETSSGFTKLLNKEVKPFATVKSGSGLFFMSKKLKNKYIFIYVKMHKFHLHVQQSIPSATKNEGESAIYRSPSTPHNQQLMETHPMYPNIKTTFDAFQNGLRVSGDNQCMGVRMDDGKYNWETYNEISERIRNFGSGLLECGVKSSKKSFVGVMAKNCPEWLITSQACASYRLILVPLYDTLGADAMTYIINQTKLSTIVVEESKLANVLSSASQCPSLKTVIKIGYVKEDETLLAKDAKVNLLHFKGVEDIGREYVKEYVPAGADDLMTICYTSGTTGNPKGVMLTHKNIMCDIFGVFDILPDGHKLSQKDLHLSFLPLAHIFEQLIANALLMVGAQIAFYRGDVSKLLEDVVEAKPTIFPAVPRLLNRIYSKINSTVNGSSFMKRRLFNWGLNAKKKLVRKGIVTNDSFWDKLIFKRVQGNLGGRVRLMITGAAPISSEVLDFFRCAFGCEVLEGYGQTESSAAICVTRVGDYSVDHGGHVGGVLACNEIKLVDIPEMNYLSTDPLPRGEVWVRGNNIFKGYYKLPDVTHETMTKDGWCKTGDVGMMLPGGTLKIIDRKKNIFKLSQGEYITPEKIENVYVKAPFVAQVFVHGESVKSCLIGIVVVDNDQLSKYCAENKIIQSQSNDDWLNSLSGLNEKILDGLVELGRLNKLYSFEQVKSIHLTMEQWTPENGMLTPSMKPKRHEIKKKYKNVIEKLYSTLD
jgi:long-chain acyl-CoA synthetase